MGAVAWQVHVTMTAHPPCALPGCDRPVIRKPDERACKYRARACCCREHSDALRARRRADTMAEQRIAKASSVAARFKPCREPAAGASFPIGDMTADQAIAAFLAERGATHCPTAAVAATTAQPSPADIAALDAYWQAEDVRRAARSPNFAWGG